MNKKELEKELEKLSKKLHMEQRDDGPPGIYCHIHGIPMYADHETETMRCPDCELEKIERGEK